MTEDQNRPQTDDEIVEQEQARTEALAFGQEEAFDPVPTLGDETDEETDDTNENGGAPLPPAPAA